MTNPSAPGASILVINAGSSSVKYQLIGLSPETVLASGNIQRIGQSGATYSQSGPSGTSERPVVATSHNDAMKLVVDSNEWLGPALDEAGIVGVGHRVVMGGRALDRPVVITDEIVATVEALSPLAPLHNPANVAALKVARELLPNVAHVAVFDTAFFHDLPPVAASYAIDPGLADKYGVRRYGFHGISHEYVSGRVTEMLGATGARTDLRQIVLHLGNGASASAVVAGRAVDTSMGFTPLEGLVMGTRSGDIDPSVAFHLYRQGGMDIDEVDRLLNQRSGMLGMTGYSDLRDVHRLVGEGDSAARLGLALYVRRIQKYIGAFAAAMGGVDAVTFTAGVGENDPTVRAAVIEGLEFLGLDLDAERNFGSDNVDRIISKDDSRVTVLVVPTREELSIARQVAELVQTGG